MCTFTCIFYQTLTHNRHQRYTLTTDAFQVYWAVYRGIGITKWVDRWSAGLREPCHHLLYPHSMENRRWQQFTTMVIKLKKCFFFVQKKLSQVFQPFSRIPGASTTKKKFWKNCQNLQPFYASYVAPLFSRVMGN